MVINHLLTGMILQVFFTYHECLNSLVKVGLVPKSIPDTIPIDPMKVLSFFFGHDLFESHDLFAYLF